jgi:hypothetical protein
MALCRVFYRVDGRVFVFYGDDLDLPFRKNPNKYNPMEFKDMDDSQIPQDRLDRDRWRGTKATGIKVDATVILRRDIEEQLDAELAKPVPNSIAALKLQRKLDKKEYD